MLLRDKPWDRDLQLLLASIIAFNLLPHIQTVPLWITGFSALCIAWKVLYLTKGFQLPRRSVLAVAAAIVFGGVLFSYGTIFGQEAAGALLVVMASLKLLETNRYRDAMLVIFTSYFLLMAYLLETQSLAATIYMVVDIALITGLMSQVHRRESGGPGWRSIWPSLRLVGLTVPLWVFVFIFFPRFSTGAWNLKPPSTSIGFSDDLNPGSVENLAESDEPAFRVNFDSAHLAPEAAYWRGSILTIGDGLKWSRSRTKQTPDAYISEKNDRVQVYTIVLESGFQKWIFALDVPLAISSADADLLQNVRRLPGFTFEFINARYARASYIARSTNTPPIQTMSSVERASLLKLPAMFGPGLQDLATRFKTDADRDPFPGRHIEMRYAKEILNWFRDQNFRYSKSPGQTRAKDGSAQLAEFLFERKVGFCEHYSAAFATLMRAMGVPARVVVGFQGAQPNQLGGYWIVRKMDAHAWTEIWQEERDPRPPVVDAKGRIKKHEGEPQKFGRWVRVDPTETIAPMRIQLGGDFNRLDQNSVAGATEEEMRRRLDSGLSGTFRQLALVSDLVQMKWNSFLLTYDFDYQLSLLSSIGIEKRAGLFLTLIVVAGSLIMGAFLFVFQRRRTRQEDPLVKEWRRFCEKFVSPGFARGASEGPLDFARRAAEKFPEQAAQIRRIAEFYAGARYGPVHEKAVHELRQLVRGFSINDNSRSTRS